MFETLDLLNISFPHSFMSTVNDVLLTPSLSHISSEK